MIGNYGKNEELNAVPKPSNVVDKYAVCVLCYSEVVRNLMKDITPFCKDNFSIFCMPIIKTTIL